MAQSYGNTSNTPILAATDEILGVTKVEQTYGTSLSGKSPADSIGIDSFDISLDGEAAQTVNFATAISDDPLLIASTIQAAVRAMVAAAPANQPAYDDFVARYDAPSDKYVLSSGTVGVVGATPAVVVTAGGGTADVPLKLGVAAGGTESTAASPELEYAVRYRFVYEAGAQFSAADVTILGSEMSNPNDLNELKTLANAKAAQIKAERFESFSTVLTSIQTINGPVTL